MSALWVVTVVVALLGAVAVAVALRRTRDEVTPAVQAFSEFRAALEPAVAELRGEVARTGERLDRERERREEPGLV